LFSFVLLSFSMCFVCLFSISSAFIYFHCSFMCLSPHFHIQTPSSFHLKTKPSVHFRSILYSFLLFKIFFFFFCLYCSFSFQGH
jgi:hypothetical protein